MNPVIQLSWKELNLARELAQARHGIDRANGIRDSLVGDQSQRFHYEFLGVAGELVFSKWANLPFNESTELQPGAPDFLLPGGITLDVKTRDRRGDLIIPLSHRKGKSQIFVYCFAINQKYFELVGWSTEKVCFMDKYIRTLRAPSRVIPVSDLFQMDDLPRAVRQQVAKRSQVRSRVQPGKLSPIQIYSVKR